VCVCVCVCVPYYLTLFCLLTKRDCLRWPIKHRPTVHNNIGTACIYNEQQYGRRRLWRDLSTINLQVLYIYIWLDRSKYSKWTRSINMSWLNCFVFEMTIIIYNNIIILLFIYKCIYIIIYSHSFNRLKVSLWFCYI